MFNKLIFKVLVFLGYYIKCKDCKEYIEQKCTKGYLKVGKKVYCDNCMNKHYRRKVMK